MLDTAIRTLLGFVILLILTRLLGKKQLSQLTVFTYITGIGDNTKNTKPKGLKPCLIIKSEHFTSPLVCSDE